MRIFFALLRKEFLQIGRNAFLPRLIVAFPLLVMLVMPLVMTMDVQNVNVAIVDADRSGASHRIASHVDACRWLTLARGVTEYAMAMEALQQGQLDVVLQIPQGFERNMSAPSPKRISIVANAVNATKGSMGVQYVMGAVRQALASPVEDRLMALSAPVRVDDSGARDVVGREWVVVQNRYNPTLEYRRYMIPALMVILFILMCGFLPALSIVGEKERGTMEQINVTPITRFTFVLSKLVPYWIIGMMVAAVAMLVACVFWGLWPVGSVGTLALASCLFVLTMSGLGLTVANFSETMQQTMFVMFCFVMVFMLMSGLLTPSECMPGVAQRVALLLPPRHYVEIVRSVYLKGAALAGLWPHFAALGLMAAACCVMAALTYRRRS